jgi:hypothetical protein
MRAKVRNTGKLLAAALIMSVYLIATSFVTTVLIPAEEFQTGGEANGRALAYLAHHHLGQTFGTPTTSPASSSSGSPAPPRWPD